MDAVRDGIAEEMRRDANLIYLGEGIAERGGCFGHSKDLWKEFGGRRVIDTPICELAFTGAATGAAATGCRAVADLMFADFMFDAATQIIHMAGKLRYMSNGQLGVPLLVRAPMGMIKCAAAHHHGAYYPAFGHCPGLIVVVPSNPADAKGLVKTALRAGDPVLFLEHKALFASKGPVPVGEHLVPFGQAAIALSGTDLTMATCGLHVRTCLEAAAELQTRGISCEVIDLRTIVPLDVETVAASLHKTGRLLVVDEAWSMFGVGAELAAAMMEHAFDDLDAPVARLHTARVPFPFSPALDSAVAVTVAKVVAAAEALLAGRATPAQASCRPARAAAAGRAIRSGRSAGRAAARFAEPAHGGAAASRRRPGRPSAHRHAQHGLDDRRGDDRPLDEDDRPGRACGRDHPRSGNRQGGRRCRGSGQRPAHEDRRPRRGCRSVGPPGRVPAAELRAHHAHRTRLPARIHRGLGGFLRGGHAARRRARD